MREPTVPKSLRWFRHLCGPITRLGIDYPQFMLIMATKLTLANRTTTGMTGARRKPKKHPRPLLWSFLGNLLIGLLIGASMLLPLAFFLKLSLLYGALFLMFFLTMLTSYASLLLDPRDRPIYTVRGVSDRTLNTAKLTIVGLFLLTTMAALALPALVVLGWQVGVGVALAGAVSALLLGLFSLVLALFMYMLVLHFFDGEKLKNLLNIVQIGLAIGLYAASQLPNLLGPTVMSQMHFNLTLQLVWWELVAVPMWFAGLPLMASGVVAPVSLLLVALSIGVTTVMTIAYMHNAGRFEQLLEKLEQGGDRPTKTGLWFTWSRRLTTHSRENAAYYTLGWRQLQAQREYKLRVYPQLAYGLIIPVALGANFMREFDHRTVASLIAYLGIGMVMAVPTAIINLKFATQPEAMAIFDYVPYAHRGQIRFSVLMAMFMRFFAPFLLLLGLVALPFAGLHALTGTLATTALTFFLTVATSKLLFRGLPFSEEFGPVQGAGNGLVTAVAVFGGMILALVYVIAGAVLKSYWFDGAITLVFAGLSWPLVHSFKTTQQ